MAGITLHFTLGENGILKNASIAGEKYEEANVKEQLTLELGSIQTKTYKETGKKASLEDIKNLINKDKYNVDIEEGSTFAQIEDIEKEYTFTVDEDLTIQDVEKITNKDKSIKIETSATNKSDYTTSTLKAKITLTEEIASIKIGEEEIELPAKTEEDGKNVYEIEKEVEENGNYKVKVETVTGRVNYKIQQVKDLSEDMEIRTAEDLVWFRDRVNNGATYKKRTITLINDLDLRSVCSKEKSWESIGKYSEVIEGEYNKFSGTFNGNNKTIDYLYIETTEELSQGLFGYTKDATISGVIIGKHSSINATRNTAGVVGYAMNSTISNCGNNGTVTGTQDCIGGIIGILDCGEIIACYNKGNVTSTGTDNSCNVGGICGCSGMYSYEENKLENIIQCSYNTGIITSLWEIGGIVGYQTGYTNIQECYNKGAINGIEGGSGCGGIAGVTWATKYENSKPIQDKNAASQVNNTCNIGPVNSGGTQIGGICGCNVAYCTVKNNYILQGVEIRQNSTNASRDTGTSSAYLGKYVGRVYSNAITNENGEITNIVKNENGIIDMTDTVYYIVNGMSDEESDYWDKGNPTEPKLKWEKSDK